MRYLPISMLLGCSIGLDATYLDPKLNDTSSESDALSDIGSDNGNANGLEICYDGIDNDGDFLIDCSDPDCGSAQECLVDNDNDGFFATNDCDDNDHSIYPGAPETAGDGVDSNCNDDDNT